MYSNKKINDKSIVKNYFNNLEADTLFSIFDYLDAAELRRMPKICKQFYNFSNNFYSSSLFTNLYSKFVLRDSEEKIKEPEFYYNKYTTEGVKSYFNHKKLFEQKPLYRKQYKLKMIENKVDIESNNEIHPVLVKINYDEIISSGSIKKLKINLVKEMCRYFNLTDWQRINLSHTELKSIRNAYLCVIFFRISFIPFLIIAIVNFNNVYLTELNNNNINLIMANLLLGGFATGFCVAWAIMTWSSCLPLYKASIKNTISSYEIEHEKYKTYENVLWAPSPNQVGFQPNYNNSLVIN